jgi:choline dehydrogenase-like flavoprotein
MDYDVIIVGGRVAGSALAALLGGQGHRVLLLEKAHFQRHAPRTFSARRRCASSKDWVCWMRSDPPRRLLQRSGIIWTAM